MKNVILHISGLFEDTPSRLFQYLQCHIELQNYRYTNVPLYIKNQFGSYSFIKETQRIQQVVNRYDPAIIVAHSLGAYVALQLDMTCPLVLLDPSLTIAEIIAPNLYEENSILTYGDGTRHTILSYEFASSLKDTPSIENVCETCHARDVCIIGAGNGGYKIAEKYAAHIMSSQYLFLPNANHDFSSPNDRKRIFEVIKKRLEIMPSRMREENYTKLPLLEGL